MKEAWMADFISQIDHRFTEKEFWRLRKEQLRSNPTPPWLLKAEEDPENFMHEVFLSRDFLNDSLFYASGGNDAQPIKHWSGLIHSFCWVDRLYDQQWFDRQIHPSHLKGYECFFNAETTMLDSGQVLAVQDEIARRLQGKEIKLEDSETPRKASRQEIRELLSLETPPSEDFTAYLYLFRKQAHADVEGPPLLSLCLLSAGAATIYYHLFVKCRITPKVLSTHNPGMGDVISLNHQKGIFYKILKLNRAGIPLFNIYTSEFPEYGSLVYDEGGYRVPSLWALNQQNQEVGL